MAVSHNINIVYIDDEVSLLDATQQFLATRKINCIIEPNSVQAIETILRVNPDLVMLDIVMPNMDGYEILSQIRKIPQIQSIPVIMVSSLSDEEDIIKGFNEDITDYITKPFNPKILVAKIERIVQNHKRMLSYNPLTQLPGNVMIDEHVKKAIQNNYEIAYIDMDNFKAYNDYYGFERGDKVILLLSEILKKYCSEHFIGHIGGDDFIVIGNDLEECLEKTIQSFDKDIKSLYDEKERTQGYIKTRDREGIMKKFGFVSISIGLIKNTKDKTLEDISSLSAQAKKAAKKIEGSNIFVIDK